LVARQKLVFLAPPFHRSNLIAIREAFLVQLADAVSRLCKALHKLVKNPYSQEIDAGTILNDILIMSPSTLVRLTDICVRFRGVLFVSPKATLRVYRAVGKYFPM
jgi:hypothetical protein